MIDNADPLASALDPGPDDEFLALALRYLDGAADSADQRVLAELMVQQADKRRAFVALTFQRQLIREQLTQQLEMLNLHCDPDALAVHVPLPLEVQTECSHHIGLAVTPAESSTLPKRRLIPRASPSRLSWASIAVLALSLLIGAMSIWAVRGSRHPISTPTANNETETAENVGDGSVGIVTRSVDAQWNDEPRIARLGGMLRVGRYELRSGLIQLEMFSGASVQIQGPSTFELESVDLVKMISGKLRAHVPPQASGFTVLSGPWKVVDRGTEFGVQTDERGGAEVHVFDGMVDLYDAAKPASSGARELASGSARHVDSAGQEQEIPVTDNSFVSRGDIERQWLVQTQRSLERWREFSLQLASDPRVVLYYSFEVDSQFARSLTNQASATEGDCDGAIIGCQWSEGRWPGKPALEFKRPSDRVRLSLPGDFRALTTMAWIRVESFDRPYSSLLLTDVLDLAVPRWQWQFSKDGRMMLSGMRNVRVISPPVIRPQHLGAWVQVATVCDPPSGLAVHYLNGVEVSRSATIDRDLTLRIGNAEIGNWGVPRSGSQHPVRTFNGRIDEFVIFHSALSAAEVQKIYEAGRPVF